MKKLIFSLVLSVGVFVSMQAQTLFIQGFNASTDNWKINLVDGSGDVATFPNIAPGGFNGGITPFDFNLAWSATNLATGCTNSGTITGPVGNTTVGLFCTVPPPGANTVTYSVSAISGTSDFVMRIFLQ